MKRRQHSSWFNTQKMLKQYQLLFLLWPTVCSSLLPVLGAEILIRTVSWCIMGKVHLSLIFGKQCSPWGLIFHVSLYWHDSQPLPLIAGTFLYKSVTLWSAYNKISLHFQLIWQTLWGTNAYNCHRLVKDLINGVFFQVQLHQPSGGFIPPVLMLAHAHQMGTQGQGTLFFRHIQTPSDFWNQSHISTEPDEENKNQQSGDDITNSKFLGVIYLLYDNGLNVYTSSKSAMQIQTSL